MRRHPDAFERELYGEPAAGRLEAVPAWRVLTLALLVFAVATVVGAYVHLVDLPPTDGGSTVVFGGLLLTLASALLAGWFILVFHAVLERLRSNFA